MRNHDLVFLKHFSQIIAILVAITFSLICLGIYLNKDYSAPNAVIEAAQRERLRPVGDVYAGATGAAAQVAAKAAAAAAAAGEVAFDGTLDGEVIFNGLCSACHGTGAGGAPKLEKGAWAMRIAEGTETLHKHAIEGFQGQSGMMPAKGGKPSLTDEQVIATVDWMLANLK